MKREGQTTFFRRNPFFRVLFREVDRMSSSFICYFTTLIGPLFAFIILLAVFNAGVPRNIAVGLVDQDNTSLSRKMGMWINAAPEVAINMRLASRDEAYRQMELGSIEGVVIIPEGTEKSIMKGMQQKIPVFINNLNILKGGYLQKGIYKTLATLSGGIKLQVAMKHGLTESQAMAKIRPVNLHQHVLFNPFGNYAHFLLTALLPLMVIMFTLLSTINAIGSELREGTGPDWLEHSSGNIIVAVAGKLVPYTVLLSVVLVVMNVVIFIQMGTPLKGDFLLIAFGELMLVFTYQLLSVVLVAVTINLRLALSLGSAYSIMALTFSGLTFPQFAMPLAADAFSYLFPFTYWVKLFISQAIRGEAIVYGMKYLAVLLIFIFISVLFFPRLKYILQNEKYWGRI
jgi:ABC-2 type transport system permease protein